MLKECRASTPDIIRAKSKTTKHAHHLRGSTSSNDKLAALLFPTFSSSSSRKESISGFESVMSNHQAGGSLFHIGEPEATSLNSEQI